MTLHYTKPLRNDASPVWVGDRYLNAADTEREHERVRGRLGVDSEGVSTHNGGGDGGHVVAEERLGRGAASAVHSGVVPLGGGNAFGEGTQKAYCAAAECTRRLCGEEVDGGALANGVGIVAVVCSNAADPGAAIQRLVVGQPTSDEAQDRPAEQLFSVAECKGVAV